MEIKPKQITWEQIPEGWMVQPKYDGECNKLIIKDGTVNLQRFEGRSKTDFYPEIIEYAEELKLPEIEPKKSKSRKKDKVKELKFEFEEKKERKERKGMGWNGKGIESNGGGHSVVSFVPPGK